MSEFGNFHNEGSAELPPFYIKPDLFLDDETAPHFFDLYVPDIARFTASESTSLTSLHAAGMHLTNNLVAATDVLEPNESLRTFGIADVTLDTPRFMRNLLGLVGLRHGDVADEELFNDAPYVLRQVQSALETTGIVEPYKAAAMVLGLANYNSHILSYSYARRRIRQTSTLQPYANRLVAAHSVLQAKA